MEITIITLDSSEESEFTAAIGGMLPPRYEITMTRHYGELHLVVHDSRKQRLSGRNVLGDYT